MGNDGIFEPVRFNGFPELKEAFLAKKLEATFILAPLAMSLREARVPIKIVYLGHRDGTAMMVRTGSKIRLIRDLKNKKVAIPNRFSNQYLILFRALKNRGIGIDQVDIVEMPPPEMPIALKEGRVDAVISGEPFMAQTEMDGYGRVLFLAKKEWPDFISCVLAVREDVLRYRSDEIQLLVEGIAKSGMWLEQSPDNRIEAAGFTGRRYYNQNPRLLEFVLTKPPDRVKYTNLRVLRKDFEEIEQLGREAGILRGTASFEDYADPTLIPDESVIKPYKLQAP